MDTALTDCAGIVVPDVGRAMRIKIDHVVHIRIAIIMSNRDDIIFVAFVDHDSGRGDERADARYGLRNFAT